MRWRTPGILIVTKLKWGKRARKIPRPKRITVLFMVFKYNSFFVIPCSIFLEKEREMETPIINKKKGNIRSVGVQPCHSACLRGA
jgi:hypothetical protein